MRIKPILAFLGAAAFSSVAFAAPAPVSVSDDGNTVTVHGDTSPVFRLTPGQAADASGAFRLKDGRVLNLSHQRNKMFMDLDGQREQLVPLSRTEFVGMRTGIQVELDEEAFAGNVKLVQYR